MTPLFGFGLSQEDERTEAAALALGPTDRVLAVCSGGEMPLSLLALGAAQVDAVDVDAHQVWLAELKRAAVLTLDREDAVGFIGLVPMPGERRLALLPTVLGAVSAPARAFFLEQPEAVARGIVWAGRYERYVGRVARVALALVGRRGFEALVDAPDREAQERIFDARIGTPALRAVFRVAFHPRIYTRRGMDPRSLQHRKDSGSLGDAWFARLRGWCTATPASENPFLQLTILGRVRSPDVVPAYLTGAGVAAIRARPDAVRFHHRDLTRYLLDLPPAAFDKAHLSNLGDWLDPGSFDRVMRLVASRAARPARLVWRYLHVDRPMPPDLAGSVRVDPARGEALRALDRFPFYAVVPAEVGP
jgi:S-adenosylmethionine:diacylglycerol 3-amino-3-carboxypropyl transferase